MWVPAEDVAECSDALIAPAARGDPSAGAAFSGGADSALLACRGSPRARERGAGGHRRSRPACPPRSGSPRGLRPVPGPAHVEVCYRRAGSAGVRPQRRRPVLPLQVARFSTRSLPMAARPGGRIALGTNLDDLGRPPARPAPRPTRGSVFPLVDAGLYQGRCPRDQPGARPRDRGQAGGRVPVVTDRLRRPVSAGRSAAGSSRPRIALHDAGFRICRVRAHGDGSAWPGSRSAEPDLDRLMDRTGRDSRCPGPRGGLRVRLR